MVRVWLSQSVGTKRNKPFSSQTTEPVQNTNRVDGTGLSKMKGNPRPFNHGSMCGQTVPKSTGQLLSADMGEIIVRHRLGPQLRISFPQIASAARTADWQRMFSITHTYLAVRAQMRLQQIRARPTPTDVAATTLSSITTMGTWIAEPTPTDCQEAEWEFWVLMSLAITKRAFGFSLPIPLRLLDLEFELKVTMFTAKTFQEGFPRLAVLWPFQATNIQTSCHHNLCSLIR